ncbi:U3 small nucleolar RNA-associated protein 4 homolog [Strongylocentrotus purpuratus]|uniref:U3 small nucleolar RNA-associated protein 4 homolog n=1 Tax=Strongylocentrotus purpuratus TaxID=7668 RepID=A0A7M7N7Y3_STRPU|nr:U3 small nucleolar RNA-associated protein 4 homolog [Strongylocentrotus purpuratus]
MSEFQVHHVKFCNYVPSGIQSLAYNQTDKVLAVGREDNSVEIWKTGEGRKWLQQKVIPGSEKRKVNSLVWVKGRLFSAGLQGDITEYDLQHLKPKKSIYYGNAFWCIAVNNAQTHIAAGCEDGYIRLYEMTDEGLIYDRSLQMQQGRVVSLAWHVSDEVIVTGSLDNIRIWNVNTGHATLRITTQRVQKHTEVVVWQVAVLDDMTIVSGDSVGRTQFWNGKHGTLLKSYTSHRASVLDLCVSQDQTSVFSAGVDPIISEFQMVQKASGSETKHWVRGRSIRDHSHDVMAVVIAGDKLVSGGVDTMLAVNPVHIEMSGGKLSKAMSRLRHRIRGFPHKPIVTLAPKARMLLLQYSHSLEVWKLGNTQASSDEDGKVLPLSEKPVKLLELRAKVGI